jgi:hypothetical protein
MAFKKVGWFILKKGEPMEFSTIELMPGDRKAGFSQVPAYMKTSSKKD